MKTIVELQDSIKGITMSLQNISVELSEYGKSTDSAPAVDFLKVDAIGKNCFLPHHPLTNCPQKSHYLSLLLTIALKNRGDLSAWQFLSRIAFGAGYTDGMESLVADAMTLNEARLIQVTDTVNQYGLKHNFVVDSLVLYTVMQEKNSALLEYMVSIYEILGVENAVMDECLTMARIIAENDKEAYFDNVNKWKYLNQWDFLGYMVKRDSRIVHELDGIENYEEEQVIVLDAKITGEKLPDAPGNIWGFLEVDDVESINKYIAGLKLSLDLDKVKCKELVFLNCTFDEMNCIVAKKKHIVFESCLFSSSFHMFNIYEHTGWNGQFLGYDCDINKLFSGYSNEAFSTHNLYAWISVENSDFIRCIFQNYRDGLPILDMRNGNISKCQFINCEKQNWKGTSENRWNGVAVTFTYFIKIANGSIVGTNFEKCTNRVDIKGNNATGCFLLADNTAIANCKFTKCQNWVGGDYGSYASNYTYLLHLSSNSSVKNCVFDACYPVKEYDRDDHVESYTIACYKGNVSMVKKLTEENKFIDGNDIYRRQKEKVGVTNREIE